MVESAGVLRCPECGSEKTERDDHRYLADGADVQRWICKGCGYRFSEKRLQRHLRPPKKDSEWHLRSGTSIDQNRQVCVALARGTKNLTATTIEKVAGESPVVEQDAKGKITEYLWHLKKEGRKDDTILAHRKVLTRLAKHGCDLFDPESVKDTIAREQIHINSKVHYVIVYKSFAEWLNLYWKPPRYKFQRRIPWIPRETEIDQLIAGFKPRTATFLMILKETMARSGEIWKLEWRDLNGNILTINAPEKNGNPRQFKISDRLVALINALPRRDKRIFGPTICLNNFRSNFAKRRHYLARTLGNPRIDQITFHTFRHFGATMLYHKTRDILYVKQQLGHRCIENTMVYTQLITFECDEYNTAFARSLEEEEKLIKVGFELVRYDQKEQTAIYRKRK